MKDWAFKKDPDYLHADHIETGKHSSELFADASIEFIENYKANNPFFMYISFMAPHDPHTMPEEFLKMYDDVDIDKAAEFFQEQ